MGTGAYHLSDVPEGEHLVVLCRRCDRRGVYDVPRLTAEHGDAALPDVLRAIATSTCRNLGPQGRCGAVFEDPLGSRVPPIVPRAR